MHNFFTNKQTIIKLYNLQYNLSYNVALIENLLVAFENNTSRVVFVNKFLQRDQKVDLNLSALEIKRNIRRV